MYFCYYKTNLRDRRWKGKGGGGISGKGGTIFPSSRARIAPAPAFTPANKYEGYYETKMAWGFVSIFSLTVDLTTLGRHDIRARIVASRQKKSSVFSDDRGFLF